MKIIHAADIHYHAGAKEQALASLDTLIETGIMEGVKLFVLAGDLFDRGVQNSDTGGLPALIERVRKMLEIAPVVVVEGTKTHDVPGCYEIFKDLDEKHNFTVIQPGIAYFYDQFNDCVHRDKIEDQAELLIVGCPEPTKEWLLASGNGNGIQETNEAIKEGMRKLLLGLGALRKEHPDIPCLMVYHGSIAGATLQNHQILPPGGIELGRDDLALVGADYYALGHIHLAQQIGDLQAYYPGSAYPLDWGEQDQKGFNLVILKDTGIRTVVQRHAYPHPPRKKLQVSVVTGLNEPGWYKEVAGHQVWVEVKGVKEDIASCNPDHMLNVLITEHGALPGSRVTTTIIPTETVRAAEITEKTLLRDKVKIWADSSEKKVSDSVYKKADELEIVAREGGLTHAGLHIRVKKLRLRGAIGIMKGQGKEEIELDLETFDPGLIALLGKNGAGKSTLIENMHPYACLLTRSGKLQDHFCLRDSFRDLYFEDTATGNQYRAFIMIDGQNASGKTEGFLTKNGEPLSDGKISSYNEQIEELFGSLNMFVQSAFVAQKQKFDVTSATQGEKKAIFRELSGLDYLQTYTEVAKQKAKEFDNEIARYSGKIETLQDLVQRIPELEMDIIELDNNVKDADEEMKRLHTEGDTVKERVAELQRNVDRNNEFRNRINALRDDIHGYLEERKELDRKKRDYQRALEIKATVEQEVQDYDDLRAKESALLDDRQRISDERERLTAEYNKACKAVDAEKQKYLDKKTAIEAQLSEFRQKKAVLSQKIDYLVEKTEQPLDEHCPTCGQILPEETRQQLIQERTELEATLKKEQQKLFYLDIEINHAEDDLNINGNTIADLEYPPAPGLPEFNDSELHDVRNELSAIDITGAREMLRKAQEAEVRIEEADSRLLTIAKQIDDATKQIEELKPGIDITSEQEHKKAVDELEELRTAYENASNRKASLEAERKGLTQQLSDLQAQKAELEEVKKSLESARAELADWQLLQEACGPNGIQALELDALAPNITEVANRLLTAAYGSRFQIQVQTTRFVGSGSKRKQAEDFQIYVLDAENGSEQSIDTLSGGESVWIKKALYDAFGIIRARNTGTKFLTVFLDEADGALDPEARERYIRMIEAAHGESGRYHTIMITHSETAQQMIAQKIEMTALEAPTVKEIA